MSRTFGELLRERQGLPAKRKAFEGAGRSAANLYNTKRWRVLRKAWRQEHPLCAECLRQGLVTAMKVVDHIEPHRGDEEMFWDEANLESLCARHHNQKTQREINARKSL